MGFVLSEGNLKLTLLTGQHCRLNICRCLGWIDKYSMLSSADPVGIGWSWAIDPWCLHGKFCARLWCFQSKGQLRWLSKVRRREIVGAGRQWEDFWIIGTWDPLGCGQNGWEMKTSVSRLPDSPGNDPEIRQTISNTAKLLSCFTPFGRFGPNILFCQQLWTHNSANPPKVGHGSVEVEGILFLRDE